jgi:dihydromethanopterin reductase (acceptor)
MKETPFLPPFLYQKSTSAVLWCYTGAGYCFEENFEQIIKLNRESIPICIIFSSAGALVANRYGFFWKLCQITIEQDYIHFIFQNKDVLHYNIKKLLNRANLSYSVAPNDPAYSQAVSLANNEAVVCIIGSPITANTTAKLANGIADTFITNLITQGLKADKNIGIFPTDAIFPEVISLLPVRYRGNTSTKKINTNICQFGAIKETRSHQIEFLAQYCVGCYQCVKVLPELFFSAKKQKVRIRKIDTQNSDKLSSEVVVFAKPGEIYNFVKEQFE